MKSSEENEEDVGKTSLLKKDTFKKLSNLTLLLKKRSIWAHW